MDFVQNTQTLVIRVKNWEEAIRIGKSLRRRLFKGQSKAEWVLKSTLERTFEERGLPVIPQYPVEELILSDFKSASHLFSKNINETGSGHANYQKLLKNNRKKTPMLALY